MTGVKNLLRSGLVVGIPLFVVLLAYQGFGTVADALLTAGWGLLAVAAFHLVPLVMDAVAWRVLLSTRARVGFWTAVFARWISESVNTLLPVAQIGGAVVRSNLVARRGVPGAFAGASVVVDVTTLVASQIAFTLLGLALLMAQVGGARLAPTALGGTVVMTVVLALFYVLQRRGLFRGLAGLLMRLAPAGVGRSLAAGAEDLDADIGRLYGQGRALLGALFWHLLAWLAGAGEVWLALTFLGHPVDFSTALLLESLGQAIRAAAFLIPGALGVQEGGYMLLGQVLGIEPQTGFALSLCKRVRELLLGLPGLVAWQFEEAKALVGDRSQQAGMEGL